MSIENENDFKVENFEQYFGDVDDVKRIIDECKTCGAKLVFNHYSDFKHLIIQETARCLECGGSNRKVIHVLN